MTSKELLYEIILKNGKKSYDQIRWEFHLQKSDKKENITNSSKAAFSRAKKQLFNSNLIQEYQILPYELNNYEFIEFAVYNTDSLNILKARKAILPIFLKNGLALNNKAHEKISLIENEIYNYHRKWDKMKIPNADISHMRKKLLEPLLEIQYLLSDHYSTIVKNQKGTNSTLFPLLFAKITMLTHDATYKVFEPAVAVEIQKITTKLPPTSIKAPLLKLSNKYIETIEEFSTVFWNHRRRILFRDGKDYCLSLLRWEQRCREPKTHEDEDTFFSYNNILKNLPPFEELLFEKLNLDLKTVKPFLPTPLTPKKLYTFSNDLFSISDTTIKFFSVVKTTR